MVTSVSLLSILPQGLSLRALRERVWRLDIVGSDEATLGARASRPCTVGGRAGGALGTQPLRKTYAITSLYVSLLLQEELRFHCDGEVSEAFYVKHSMYSADSSSGAGKGIAVSSDDTLPHFEGPYAPPYTIVQFLLFLVDLLDCIISNLLIP